MKRIIPLLLFIAAPAVASADGWVYSVPDGNQWWDQGILEWTDPSGFHNVVSNIARSGTSLSIGNNGSNPLCVNLDFSVGIEGDWTLVGINGGTMSGAPVTNLVCPPTMKTIGWSAFENNKSLRSLVLNEGLESLDKFNNFRACTALESFSGLPSTLTTLGGQSFRGDTKLTGDIVWPSGISSCDAVFAETGISSFIATNGLKSVDGYAAFGGCPNLSKIVFGPDFEYFGRRAFGDNSGIKVDQHIYFANFPARGFSSEAFDGGKRHAVTLHMEWSAKDDWDAWMSTNTVFVTDPPASTYAKGDLEKGSWTDWNMRVWLMWWHTPIASVGGTDYTSLRAAMAAAAGAAIELLAPCVADFTDERVALEKNEALVVVNDDGHVLGYEPGVPDAPGWKLAVSRQTRGETPVVVYKAVGPAMVILLK